MRYPLLEGFDYYNAVAVGPGDINTRWNVALNTGALTLNPGLGGDGKCLSFWTNGLGGSMGYTFPTSRLLTLHFAIRIDSLTEQAANFIRFCEPVGGAIQFGIDFDFGGHLRLTNGAHNTVWASSTQVLQVGHVYRCCWQMDLTSGKTRLSINGTLDPTFTLDASLPLEALQSVGIIQLCKSSDDTTGHSLDDLILGIDECVDWGPQELVTKAATADVVAQWTRSTGAANFSNVDDIPFTADADYNSSSTVGQKDIFDYGDPPHTPESVLCVQIVNIARKEESAVRKFKDLLHVGAADFLGDEHNLDEAYGHWFSTWTQNPVTGLAWTAADIVALQGGYQLTQVD